MVKEHIQRVMHSSSKSDWRTPFALYDALDQEFAFTLDVAAGAENALCDSYWDVRCNGLTQPWTKTCFMNPPYSKKDHLPIDPWIDKAWRESQAGATIVGVLPFNPQTRWFRWYVMGLEQNQGEVFHAAAELRMLPHRVTFNRPDGTPADNAPGNTCIVIWKPNPGYVGPWQPAVRYWTYRKDT